MSGSGLCHLTIFGINAVETSGFATTELANW